MAKGDLYTACAVSAPEYNCICLDRRMFFKRLYHAARLRWNSIERRRTPDDDKLIDDVSEWALWHYATGVYYGIA